MYPQRLAVVFVTILAVCMPSCKQGSVEAVYCYHSTCPGGYCDATTPVTTFLVDCSKYQEQAVGDEGIDPAGLTEPGHTANEGLFDVCQTVESNVDGPISMTLYACGSTSIEDTRRFRCNRATFGDDPWSDDGLHVQQGQSSIVSRCCQTDGCNRPPIPEALVAKEIAAEAHVAATVAAVLAVDLDLVSIPADTSARETFVLDFRTDVAARAANSGGPGGPSAPFGLGIPMGSPPLPIEIAGDLIGRYNRRPPLAERELSPQVAAALAIERGRITVTGLAVGSVLVGFNVAPGADFEGRFHRVGPIRNLAHCFDD